MLRLPFALLALLVMSLPLAAQSYRLVMGDRVIVYYDFLEVPKTTTVDLDGNIRLSELGRIHAQGRTLDEVEEAITEGMIQGGFRGVSFVSVEIEAYAPIVVSGFVKRSGQYDYMPGMTVGAAVAVAGGSGSGGDAEGPNSDIQELNARRRAGTAAELIATAVADIARLEAFQAEDDTAITLDDVLREAVPAQLRDDMDERLAAEARLLANTRDHTETMLASWAQEVADFEVQIGLLDGRIALKEEIVSNLVVELADLDNLRAQGLTTISRFSTLQQRLADDREELLSLETAKVTARRSAGMAARNRDQFLAEQREAVLTSMAEAQMELAAGQRDYRFALDELTVLSDGAEAIATEAPLFKLHYILQGPRADRVNAIDRDTPILPGDILVVDVSDGF